MVWGGRREEGSAWGTHVYLWWIHFNIWQNQHNIVKLKNKIKLKKKKSLSLRTRHQSQVYHGVNEELQGSLPPRESTGRAENWTRGFHESSHQHSHLIMKGGRNGQGWVGDRGWRRARLSCLPSELEAEWSFCVCVRSKSLWSWATSTYSHGFLPILLVCAEENST